MKLLMPIMSVRNSKIILLILLGSILTMCLSLATNQNIFASQVWESPIAQFTYSDNWNLISIIGNGGGIVLQHVYEPSAQMNVAVFQDVGYNFVNIVEDYKQFHLDNGANIDQIISNLPGYYEFLISYSAPNGAYMIGNVQIQQIQDTNDIAIAEYSAESSKYQQYYDYSGIGVLTKLSPQEVDMNQNFNNPNQYANNDQNFNDQIFKLKTEINNMRYQTLSDSIDMMDGSNDWEFVD
jgi:hypothetical protein